MFKKSFLRSLEEATGLNSKHFASAIGYSRSRYAIARNRNMGVAERLPRAVYKQLYDASGLEPKQFLELLFEDGI